MDSPVCLIENTKDGKLVVNAEAVGILSGIRDPVVVVSIVGLYRTGKSYLMNKLAGAKKGFNLGYKVQAETKGIWMWCIPHPTKLDHTLVLLDTEGLGDVEKGDKKNDIWIFCLAVLLSSALVYNSKGTIDQDAIDKLKFVGDIAELIKVKSHDNDDEEAEFSQHFPIFIWAVRDFHLRLNVDGKSVTEDEYLENALKLRNPEKTTKDEDFNRPRKRLRMYFRSRKCFVFDQPSPNKEDLQNMDNICESALNPQFLEQTKRFCDYVFREAETKKVIGMVTVTGSQLGKLAEMYTEAVMTSRIACMEDVAHTLSDMENQAAVQEAAQQYENKMKENVVLPTQTLDQFLTLSREYENEALQIFLKRSFKDKDQTFLQQYMKLIDEKKSNFGHMNEAKSQELCEALILKLSMEHEEAVTKGSYTIHGGHEKFKQNLKAIEDKFNNEPGKGVQAEIVLKEYLKSQEHIGYTILKSDEALTAKEKEIEEEKARKKIEEMEQKVREMEESQEKRKLEDNEMSMEKNMMGLLEKVAKERAQTAAELQRVIAEKERERDSFEKQGFTKQANMYRAQIEDLQEKEKGQQEPEWYTPIMDTFKSVAKTVLPVVIEVGGAMLQAKATKKWKTYKAK
ncbi:guanylate-binding protein 1-like [Hyla sarda]|uniref:guanylate-binding protein 1-like n=1 Tax=Hyla sarda TaxID=327740 RepID=UPI0024C469AB|nr:guanylate-binding protein 1-like [Hyla sarda]XP_056389824.1 guanylate-binding protein 1-like [Hyla sarda]